MQIALNICMPGLTVSIEHLHILVMSILNAIPQVSACSLDAFEVEIHYMSSACNIGIPTLTINCLGMNPFGPLKFIH